MEIFVEALGIVVVYRRILVQEGLYCSNEFVGERTGNYGRGEGGVERSDGRLHRP